MTLMKASARESHVAVVLTEGKNREIRRIFAAVDSACAMRALRAWPSSRRRPMAASTSGAAALTSPAA